MCNTACTTELVNATTGPIQTEVDWDVEKKFAFFISYPHLRDNSAIQISTNRNEPTFHIDVIPVRFLLPMSKLSC